jgi:hypothetical protein
MVLLIIIFSSLHFLGYSVDSIEQELFGQESEVINTESNLDNNENVTVVTEFDTLNPEMITVNVENKNIEFDIINELRYESIPTGSFYSIKYPFSLNLNKINKKVGDYVSKGDVLATINLKSLKSIMDNQRKKVNSLNQKTKDLKRKIVLLNENKKINNEEIAFYNNLIKESKEKLKFGHVTQDKYNEIKTTLFQVKRNKNIEEISLNDAVSELSSVDALYFKENNIFIQQNKLLKNKVIKSEKNGFISDIHSITNTYLNINEEIFKIEKSENRILNINKKNKDIVAVYLLKSQSLNKLEYTENKSILSVIIPRYLDNKKSNKTLKIVLAYSSTTPIFSLPAELVYEDRYIWIVNDLEQIEPVSVSIVGKTFNGAVEEWALKTINNNSKQLNVVKNRLSNVEKKQQVKVIEL